MRRLVCAIVLGVLIGCSGSGAVRCGEPPAAVGTIDSFMAVVSQKTKPFIIVATGAGQGVVIREDGYALTAAHVTYDQKSDSYPDELMVSFRKHESDPWPGAVSIHKATFVDVGHKNFFEEYYKAKVLKQEGKPIIEGKDVALLKIETTAKLPHVEFYSKTKPRIEVGDKLYMGQYCFPTHKGDPTFLVTPLEVIGAVEATAGVQYLAQGFFRWGSSGAAILKDGKLIGIQSNGYAVNSPGGETQLGHLSFEVVYEDMVDKLIDKRPVDKREAEPAQKPK